MLISRLHNAVGGRVLHGTIASIATPLLLGGCFLVRERQGVAGHDTCGEQAQPSERSIRKAILEYRFLMLSLALFILYTGILIPFNFIADFARDQGGMKGDWPHYLVSITYAGSFFGRIGSGLLADNIGW